jgi:hypothetical protein
MSQTYIYIKQGRYIVLNKKYIINELPYIVFYYRTKQRFLYFDIRSEQINFGENVRFPCQIGHLKGIVPLENLKMRFEIITEVCLRNPFSGI